MSGIYIPGMVMPDSCTHFRFAVDGWCYAYGKPNVDALTNDGVTNWCPLVPVPEHGDLIDRDKLEKDIERYVGGEESRSRFHHWVQVQRSVILKSEEEQT